MEAEHSALEVDYGKLVMSDKETKASLQLAEIRLATATTDRSELQNKVSSINPCRIQTLSSLSDDFQPPFICSVTKLEVRVPVT